MGILEEIVRKKKERLSAAKSKTPLSEIRLKAKEAEGPSDFGRAVTRGGGGIRLIAEVKRASPSRGVIRKDFDPVRIASLYKDRADAVSVLTEEDFFLGDPGYLREVKKTSGRPALRKDFLFDEYQIYESRAWGADAILLIGRILSPSQAGEFVHLARELSLSVLFEVEGPGGLEKAVSAGAKIIGVNNRNLETFEVSLETTFKTKKEIPSGITTVSESGIRTRQDVLGLQEAGIDAVLVGTAFMEADDIKEKIEELMGVR